MTDHGTCSGHVSFFRDCKSAGVKPLLGVEAYHNYNGHRYHICLIARNEKGYKNILAVQSDGGRKNNRYNIVDLNLVDSENVVVTTGCSGGLVTSVAQSGDEDQLNTVLLYLQSKFKYLFTEFQPNTDFISGYSLLLSVSDKLGIPYIVTTDIHYRAKEDYIIYQDIHRIMTQKEPNLELGWLYPWDTQDLNSYFIKHGFPNSFVKNADQISHIIADNCNVEIDFGRKWHFDENIDKAWEVCKYNLMKLDPPNKLEYIERLSYEMHIFKELELVGYLMFCREILEHCRQHNIPYGPGRGSCAGSLVCYLLNIVEIDPLVFGLSFDRFLSPSHTVGILNSQQKTQTVDIGEEQEVWYNKV